MIEMVDLLREFDGSCDAYHYMDALITKGVLYEHIDANMIVIFDDKINHEKQLELTSVQGWLFETAEAEIRHKRAAG